MADEIAIQGRVVFPAGGRPDEAARVVVRVEDVSRADAASVPVSERVLEHVRLPQDGGSVPFEIRVPRDALDPRGRYSMRVHVDVNGSGAVTSGDFVSTRSYALRPEQPDAVIEVQRV